MSSDGHEVMRVTAGDGAAAAAAAGDGAAATAAGPVGGRLEPDPAALAAAGVHTVVVASPDLQGRLFGRRVPVEQFGDVLSDGVDAGTCVLGWDIAQNLDMLTDGSLQLAGFHNGMPDLLLLPDPTTLRRAGWLEGVAICLADPVNGPERQPVAVSPRAMLRRQIARLAATGHRAVIGTEIECYLYRGSPRELRRRDYRRLEPTVATRADFSIMQVDGYQQFVTDLRSGLAASGIDSQPAQVTWGVGQWSARLGRTDPLTAADQHALFKLAMRELASAAGLTATFMAKPQDGQPGSGCHVRLSLRELQTGRPVFAGPPEEHGIPPALHAAIGGLLARLPELMVLYAPTVNSYRRTLGEDVAGWGRTWGFDNRTCSVRVFGRRADDLVAELRVPGADANPYLVHAGILAGVVEGLSTHPDLPPPVLGNAYESLDDTGMPVQLGAAADLFADSDFARAAFGDDVVDHYSRAARFEWEQFLGTVTDWERRRYLELI